MADLIGRDAVLSDINEEIEAYQEYPEDKLIRKGLCIARKSIENAPAVNRWIPVEDALPEVYERVLTADRDGNVRENFRCNIKTGELEWSYGFWITHWMPLPEPPESEVQEDKSEVQNAD